MATESSVNVPGSGTVLVDTVDVNPGTGVQKRQVVAIGDSTTAGQFASVDSSGRLQTKTQDPLSFYKIADIDSTGPSYYGFVAITGAWYILKVDQTVSPNTYRYANASNNAAITGYHSGVTQAWTTRTSLTYGYLDTLTGL